MEERESISKFFEILIDGGKEVERFFPEDKHVVFMFTKLFELLGAKEKLEDLISFIDMYESSAHLLGLSKKEKAKKAKKKLKASAKNPAGKKLKKK